MDSVPDRAFQKLGTAVRKPVADVEVRIKRRVGWEGVRWRFEGGRERLDFKALGTDSDGEQREYVLVNMTHRWHM